MPGPGTYLGFFLHSFYYYFLKRFLVPSPQYMFVLLDFYFRYSKLCFVYT